MELFSKIFCPTQINLYSFGTNSSDFSSSDVVVAGVCSKQVDCSIFSIQLWCVGPTRFVIEESSCLFEFTHGMLQVISKVLA